MTICILETSNVVPSINLWSSFAVRDKITADSAVALAVYSGSVFFSMQFSKYRFLFLHYFQMNCTTGKYVDLHAFSSNIYASLIGFYCPLITIKLVWCTKDIF